MSLTLDPTLLAAQDNLVRKPIVELISTQPAPAIPFDGEYFNASDIPEIGPDIISHSSGRMVSAFIRDSLDLIIIYTDVDRIRWIEQVIPMTVLEGGYVTNLSICEMSNGNIGIIITREWSNAYTLQQIRITSMSDEGITSTSPVNIATHGSPVSIDEPFVILLSDSTFLLVYSHYNDTTEVYSILKRTSSDFISWSASSTITLSGLTDTHDTHNPSLVQEDSDDILLFFNYATQKAGSDVISNIYSIESADNGVTWGAPVLLTSYDAWSARGEHPHPVLTEDNDIKLSFHETSSVLKLNYNSDLWQNDCTSPAYSVGASLHFDPATKKLYVKQIRYGTGTKKLCGVVVVDVDSWVVDRNYNTGTVPDYSNLFNNVHVWYGAEKHHSEGKYVAISTMDDDNIATMVINNETETIVTYVFKANGAYGGISVNIDEWVPEGATDRYAQILGTWVDENSERVYLLIWIEKPLVGYIDLTEAADPHTGNYTFRDISYMAGPSYWQLKQASGGLMVIPEKDRFCLFGIQPIVDWEGKLFVYSLTSGDLVKEYSISDDPTFPYRGIGHCTYRDGHIFAMIEYSTLHSQGIYRGLFDLNIDTEVIQFHRPTYATVNQYDFFDGVIIDDDRMGFAAGEYGVVIFNTLDGSWILYDNDSIPGFETGDQSNCVSIAYNSTDGIIYVGSVQLAATNSWPGIRAISEGGSFHRGKYMTGELIEGSWSFSSPADLSLGLTDYDFSIAIDEEGILWSEWIRRDISFLSTKWDKDQAELNLEDYLIGEVNLKRDIVNIGQLSFRLSHGYLFDFNNSLSVLKIFSKKGRPVTLRFGEKIDGIDYWENQGTYYIRSTKVSYSRGSYPSISITCEDRLSLLEKARILVSEYYSDAYPEPILRDLIKETTDLEEADMSITDFSTRHEIWHQVVDENLIPCIREILDHFQYFLYMDVDNKLTTRRVKTSVDSIDHEYSVDAGVLMNFSPDDNYSDFTNRVIVVGEARDLIEVLYAEELITNVAGSGGWWESGSVHETVYFSEDHEKKVRNVRLNIIKSIEDFKILWQESGGSEQISYEDPGSLYIIITIEFPGLQGVLIAFFAAIVAVGIAATYCDYASETGGTGCGVYIMLFSILCAAAGYVLGQVATYDYEVWGRPVGEEKQSIQAIANDTEFQNYLNGLVVTASISDPFCYTVASCSTVAEYELAVAKAQRKRVTFSKITHLQDEVGDIIKAYHPYSGNDLNIFITGLTRSFIPGKSGSFIDKIEGWNI